MGALDWLRHWNWKREAAKLGPPPAKKDAPSIKLTSEEHKAFREITEKLK